MTEKYWTIETAGFFEIEELPEFHGFDEFNPGNPIKAFIGGHGFFIFEKGIHLLDAARQYITRAATESCGKCTPCRVGTQIIREKLEILAQGNGDSAVLDDIKDMAEHVRDTSLCGLGQTATVALLEMIKYFREELVKDIETGQRPPNQPCTTYVTAPCIEACPSKVDVPKYIDYVKDGKFTHSVGVILQKYPMAATCGRVCVRFCEMACRRTQVDEAVGIKILKRFVADHETGVADSWFSPDLIAERKNPDLKVAVVGAGPAGVSAAYHLLLRGYPVDVYEALGEPGGMAGVGIPSYRLPKEVLRKEVEIISRLGGRIFYGQRMGEDYRLADLFAKGYQAVFLGIGAHLGKSLGVAGEDEVVSGYENGVGLLLRINHEYINKGMPLTLGDKVVVIGGGNVAMDCVRSAVRLGVSQVHLVYRRTREEMPADKDEIEGAEKEGVVFHFLSHPRRIMHENGRVKALELIRMKPGAPDASGRRSATPVDGSEYVLETDYIVPAIGQQVDFSFISPEDNLAFNKWGLIEVGEQTQMTTRRGGLCRRRLRDRTGHTHSSHGSRRTRRPLHRRLPEFRTGPFFSGGTNERNCWPISSPWSKRGFPFRSNTSIASRSKNWTRRCVKKYSRKWKNPSAWKRPTMKPAGVCVATAWPRSLPNNKEPSP